jgi:hypothetical protein
VQSVVEPSGQLLSIHRMVEDPAAVHLFTGFESFGHFLYLYQCIMPAAEQLLYKSRQLDCKDELFLFLVKLRQDKEEAELAYLFGISLATVSRVFNTWLNFLFYQFQDLDLFIPKDLVDKFMPDGFREKFPDTRIILDATEIKINKPSNVKDQV